MKKYEKNFDTILFHHTSTVCRCECDTLSKALIFNVSNFTGFSVII